MALFKVESEEEKQGEYEARPEARRARAREARQALAEYLASPAGEAKAAYAAGQAFFQFTTDISKVQGHAAGRAQQSEVTRPTATDVLGQIEEEGWRLENIGYVFVETGVSEWGAVQSSGAEPRTQGYVEGVYLFRRVSR